MEVSGGIVTESGVDSTGLSDVGGVRLSDVDSVRLWKVYRVEIAAVYGGGLFDVDRIRLDFR